MKILFIEDTTSIVYLWKSFLDIKNDEHVLLEAASVDEALKVLNHNPDISIVVFDGCIIGGHSKDDEPNSLEPVEYCSKNLKAVKIAASSFHSKELMKAGCDLESVKDISVPKLILELISKMEQ
jgi:hypothetical protein